MPLTARKSLPRESIPVRAITPVSKWNFLTDSTLNNSEQLNSKIHETFALVRNSVEAELHGATPAVTVTTTPAAAQSGNTGNYNHGRNGNSSSDAPASPKQINYLLTLASRRGITPQQIAVQNNVANINQLSKKQCSTLIEQWKAA